ncbi:hypothetical protein [Bacillus sp. EAC]|uniref:hypothetical protein n=1 Tax=Bacillus sp. EAC TaxID=1978338 RepID=UPI000B43450B|nr:hypothetical protein [Bacillus sp. EAC]
MNRLIYSFLLALVTFFMVLGIQYLFGFKNFHYIMLVPAAVIALFVPVYYKKTLGNFGISDVLIGSLFLLILGSVSIRIFPPTIVRDSWDLILPYINVVKIVLTFLIVSIVMKYFVYLKKLS